LSKKFSLKNKPVAIGTENTRLSLLPADAKEELKMRIARGNGSTETDTIDITAYLPTAYTYQTVSCDQLYPAPEEWNFFTKPSKEKILALAESVYYNGLLQPIVIWSLDDTDTKFRILAGHTRVEAYKILRETLQDAAYTKIPAFVFRKDALTEDEARDIVCDTNFMQRGTLSAMETARCIALKAKRIKENGLKYGEGSVASKISAYYHIKRSSVFRWQRIANLIPELAELAEKRELTSVNMYKLAAFSPKEQQKIYRSAADYISNHTLRPVKAKHRVEDIVRMMKDDAEPEVPLRFSVPTEELNGRRPLLILIDKDAYPDILKTLKQKKTIKILD